MGKESFSTADPGNGAGRAKEKHWSYPDCGRGSLGRLIFEDVHLVLLLLGTWFKKHRKEFSERQSHLVHYLWSRKGPLHIMCDSIFCFLKDVWYYFHKKKKPNVWDSKQ